MALSDINATSEQLDQLAREQERLTNELKRQRERELARAEGPFYFVDANETQWGYSVIDGTFARIDSCNTSTFQLAIPIAIHELPVLAIGLGACSNLESVEEIDCPPAIASIEAGAFQICRNLRRIAFPACVDEFDPSWLQRCDRLEELTLPGRLEVVPRSVFAAGHLKRLVMGASALAIEPGTFEDSELASIEVDPANPHLASDGNALYSSDGTEFIALCRPVSRYDVASECKRIASKAAYGLRALESITLPPSVQVIDELAFARSGVKHFNAPADLRSIGPKAFFQCGKLESVELNDGLRTIGDSAFEGSAIGSFRVPASVSQLGYSVVRATDVTFTGAEATFSISDESATYLIDEASGLYRQTSEGLELAGLLDEDMFEYEALDGTVAVAPRALLRHPHIERITLPEGVKLIGELAFRGCRRLKHANLPASLVELGAEAFADTGLESFRVPASLIHIGDLALATYGVRRIGSEPTIRCIEVDPDNATFELIDGLLCERTNSGRRIIAFDNAHAQVRFPHDAIEVASFALGNAHGIRELWLNAALSEIGQAGLMIWSAIEQLHVELHAPVEGRTHFDFTFPATAEAIQAASNALGSVDFVNVREIARLCDKSILNCHNYVRPAKGEPSAYDQARLMVARLEDPVLLDENDHTHYRQTIEGHLERICVDIARHDDRAMLDSLANLGFISSDNIERIVSAIVQLEDAATTAHLLEMKRRRFQTDPFDFSI